MDQDQQGRPGVFKFSAILVGLLGVIAGAIMVALYHLVTTFCTCHRRPSSLNSVTNTRQNVQNNPQETSINRNTWLNLHSNCPLCRADTSSAPGRQVALSMYLPEYSNTSSAPDNATNTSSSPPPFPFSSQIYPIDQNGTYSTIITLNPPPPFPDAPRSVDLSPLEFILALMAVVTIPAIIYAFFFAVKCPVWVSRERPESPPELPRSSQGSAAVEVVDRRRDPVSGVKYQKETHSKDIGIECPVEIVIFIKVCQMQQI
ncbi:putative RING-H2 finger protein ATL2J [Corchorus capsularis]|uniref:Putative RING-H2 finger protein ATL2J n=1 Tax=Corchorus capsularis TaxID=210143 RepID=A0A1R3H7A9_COCAP|nr:putative RING-H2 finger protein ATL2J [Corchorus capsularis]